MARRWIIRSSFLTMLLLLVVTLFLWPLSHYEYMAVSYTRHSGTTYTFSIGDGRVFFTYQADYDPSKGGQFDFTTNDISKTSSDWSYQTWKVSWDDNVWFEGGGIFLDHFKGPLAVDELLIPFSYLTVLFGTFPLLAWRWRRRRKVRTAFEVVVVAKPRA